MFYDQFNDPNFRSVEHDLAKIARDKLSAQGVIVVTKYKRSPINIMDLLGKISEEAKISPSGDGFDYGQSASGSELAARALADMHKIHRAIKTQADNFRFRAVLKDNVDTITPDGMFPINNPIQSLMSFIYANAQKAPDNIMNAFDVPMVGHFGPKTFKIIKKVVGNNPIDQVTSDKNKLEVVVKAPEDGYPPYQTVVPRLVESLKKLNSEFPGKLDSVIKAVVDKAKDTNSVTTKDRTLQTKIVKALVRVLDRHKAEKVVGTKLENVVFNTDLEFTGPEIIKVGDALIDLDRLRGMDYLSAKTSLSPQVADMVYNEDKSGIDVKKVIKLMNNLQELDLSDAENKEVKDRVYTPLKVFLEPDDSVVDKLTARKPGCKK